MRKFLLLSLFASLSSMVSGQNIEGSWYGILNTGRAYLPVVFNINETGNGYSGTIDSPLQDGFGMILDSISMEDSRLIIMVDELNVEYEGALVNDNLIEGEFYQRQFFDLNLTRLLRPQEPLEPFDYRSEDVTFRNQEADATLAGTLTLPGEGFKSPYPAVILVSGSGLQNRNSEILYHKPFFVLADHLTRNGIAVLRYDDRGYAESTGSVDNATTADFAQDALHGFEYLLSHPEIDHSRIGVIGHSEGGTVAMMLAADNSDVAFVVSMAGMGLAGDELLVRQNQDILISEGISENEAAVYGEALKRLYRYRKEMSNEEIKENLPFLRDEVINDEVRDVLSASLLNNINQLISYPFNDWFLYFVNLDPVDYLQRVKCPVFALNGGMDLQVNAELNLAAIQDALVVSGNDNYKIKLYPELNHLFQNAESGKVIEYLIVEETISPEVLYDIADWINSL